MESERFVDKEERCVWGEMERESSGDSGDGE